MQSRAPIVIFTVIITALITSVLWIGGAASFYHYSQKDKPSLVVTADLPSNTRVGEFVTLDLTVTNPTDEKIELKEIDIYHSLLNGFTIVGISPEPTDRNSPTDFSSFVFSQELGSGETFRVSMKLQAKKAGSWSGDVDFCVPSGEFTTASVVAFVSERDASPKDGGVPVPLADEYETPRPPFILKIDAPQEVVLGETLHLKMRVTNPTDKPLMLDSIDIQKTLLEGFEIVESIPEFRDESTGDYTTSYYYEETIPPKESREIVYHLTAKATGIWGGDVDFCNSSQWVTSWVAIRVNPAHADSPAVPGDVDVENDATR